MIFHLQKETYTILAFTRFIFQTYCKAYLNLGSESKIWKLLSKVGKWFIKLV